MCYYDNNQIINMTLCILEKIKFFKEFADKKSIKIKHKIENNLFAKIDPYAIDRVVNNLLENAIKYTPARKCIIVELSGQRNKVILKVEDNGLGIVKKIIDLVNGEIHVQSKVHKGSCFTMVRSPSGTPTRGMALKRQRMKTATI
ncbi:MAG: ATP-binding protein [Spirochaetaceae bacterium]|nr:MAG: ATP-binding protein [Spirochaetaceae bacterium]